MSSRNKYQSKSHVPSVSKVSSTNGSGSKRTGVQAANNSGHQKPTQIQVIFNGKISTPQSLLPRRDVVVSEHGKKSKHDHTKANVPTIDETDGADKILNVSKGRGKRMSINSLIKSGGTFVQDSSIGKLKPSQQEEEHCIIRLQETETIIQFALTSFISPSDVREIKEVEERNARYEAMVQAHKNADNYVNHSSQTMNNPLKNQNDMAAPNAVQDFECQADPYDIRDEFHDRSFAVASGTDTGTDMDDGTGYNLSVRKFINDTVGVAVVSPGCLLDPYDLSRPRNPGETHKEGKPREDRRHRGASKSMAASRVGMDSSRGDIDAIGASKSFAVEQSGGKSQGNSGVFAGALSGDGRSETEPNSESGFLSDPNIATGTAGVQSGPQKSHRAQTVDMDEILREREAQQVLNAPLLLKRLQMLERAVQQNAYHRQHLDYRDLPDVRPLSLIDINDNNEGLAGLGVLKRLGRNRQGESQSNDDSAPDVADEGRANDQTSSKADSNDNVKMLFRYTNAQLVQGRSVTAMAWNAVNTDLLAVGYGKLDSFTDEFKSGRDEVSGGLVLFWSLRNPDYPEKILSTTHAVTSLDFSKLSPMTLAVGFINGDVSVYDVKREFNWTKPIESSANSHTGHADPVWQVKWVVKGIERFETLVSISTDGSILEWNLKKGMVVTTLMQLKRSGTEGWISRTAAGLCFDFLPNDPNTYIVGTEEGALHRCSVSYSEQYLDSYEGHAGPVYRVRFSTRWPNIFLSVGADWMIHLYHISIRTPLLTLRTANEDFAINDLSWCPGNSTIFAAVTANSKLEIWDLSVSSIDPIALIDTFKDQETPSQSVSTGYIEDSENVPGTPTTALPNPVDVLASSAKTEAPVTKLLKNLTQSKSKRELTCVQFGERSPTIAVGDNFGTVIVYRVINPQTITHEGPMQQTLKLKDAINQQVDPATQSKLLLLETSTTRKDSSSQSQAPASLDDADRIKDKSGDAEELPLPPQSQRHSNDKSRIPTI